jgi:hypothetical protein
MKSWLARLASRWARHFRPAPSRRPPRRVRPTLEALEDRINPSPTFVGSDLNLHSVVDEKQAFTLNVFASDADKVAITAKIDWFGDGTDVSTFDLNPVKGQPTYDHTGSVSHTYTAASGSFTVKYTLTASDGSADGDVGPITVNPALSATFSNGGDVAEGSTGSVMFSDVTGGSGGYTYSFNDNGHLNVTGSTSATATVPASDLADGPATLTVNGTVTDSVGGTATFPTTIRIKDAKPTVNLFGDSHDTTGPPMSGVEGAPISLFSTVTPPANSSDAAPFHYSWSVTKDVGDGNGPQTFGTPGSLSSYSFTPDDVGTYVVTLDVTDGDLNATDPGTQHGMATATIQVTDAAPTATITTTPAPAASPVGTQITLRGRATPAANTADTQFNLNWTVTKDGADFTPDTDPTRSTLKFTPDAPGTYVVKLSASDKDITDGSGLTGMDSRTVDVWSAAIGSVSSPQVIGTPLTITSTTADPGGKATLTYAWSATNGSDRPTGNQSSFTFTPLNSGNYTVRLTVTDQAGNSVNDQQDVNVHQELPTATIDSFSTPLQEGGSITVNSTAGNLGVLGSHKLTPSWTVYEGDTATGTPFVPTFTGPAGTGGHLTYSFTAGPDEDYTIVFTVTDDAGNSATATRTITVGEAPTTVTPLSPVTVLEQDAPTSAYPPIQTAGAFSDPGEGAGDLTYSVSVVSDTVDGAPGQQLFSSVSIDHDTGALTLTPTALYDGTDVFDIVATDKDGGATVDTHLTVNVQLVNHAPVLTAGAVSALTVAENSGVTSLGLTGATFGPGGGPGEATQTLTYTVTALPAPLGDVFLSGGVTPVTVGETLTLGQLQGLVFATRHDVSGDASLVFTVQDNGGTANGGHDTLTETLPIKVTEVEPSLQLAGTPPGIPDQTAVRGDLDPTDPNHIKVLDTTPTKINLFSYFSSLDPADPDRNLTFTVTGNTNSALVTGTTITANDASLTGSPTTLTLSYANNVVGSSEITVVATDNDTVVEGGVATPSPETISATFMVTVQGPILEGTSLTPEGAPYYWDGPLKLEYTIHNDGPADAGSFSVHVVISNNAAGPWNTSDPPVTVNGDPSGVFQVNGVEAHQDTSGTINVTMPFGKVVGVDDNGPDTVYLGLIIDPEKTVVEIDHSAESGQSGEVATVTVPGIVEASANKDFQHADVVSLGRQQASGQVVHSLNLGTATAAIPAGHYTFTLPPPGFVNSPAGGLVTVAVRPGTTADGALPANVNPHIDLQALLYGPNAANFASPDSTLLFQSDGVPGGLNPLLSVHLQPGTYFLVIGPSPAAAGAAALGSYVFDLSYTPSLQPSTTSAGADPKVIATGDFTGPTGPSDGITDIATADGLNRVVTIQTGLGDGTFQSSGIALSTSGSPTALVATHIGGNKALDLVVADQIVAGAGSDALDVFRGDGKGDFKATTILLGPGNRPVSLAAADLNGDGYTDLIVGLTGDAGGPPTDARVEVLLWDPKTGAFDLPPAIYDLGEQGQPRALAVLDADGDGDVNGDVKGAGNPPDSGPDGDAAPDIVVGTVETVGDAAVSVDVAAGKVYALHNKGDGSFGKPTPLADSSSTLGLVVGDFNGDGVADVAAAAQHVLKDGTVASGIDVFLGQKDGSFAKQPFQVITGVAFPSTLAAADLNGAKDAKGNPILDLLALNHDDNSVDILLGKGDGTFGAPQRVAVGLQPSALAVADLTGDGTPDLVTVDGGDPTAVSSTNNTIDTLTVVLGNGDGTFRSPSRFDVGNDPRGSVAADFTNNGILDLAVADKGSGAVSVLLGHGNGTFDAETLVPLGTNPQPVAVVAADFNGDGRADFATANVGKDGTNTVSVVFGDGDGTFRTQAIETLSLFPTVAGTDLALVTADFNGDGRPDLAVAGIGMNGDVFVEVLLDGPGGTFTVLTPFDTGVKATSRSGAVLRPVTNLYPPGATNPLYPKGTTSPHVADLALAAGKLDGDGAVDLALVQQGTDAVVLLDGQGDGTFARSPVKLALPAHTAPTDVLVADLNDDGAPDLAVAVASLTSDVTLNSVTVFLADRSETTFADRFASPHPYAADTNKADSAFVAAPIQLAAGNFFFADDQGPLGQGPLDDLAVRMVNSQVAYLTNNLHQASIDPATQLFSPSPAIGPTKSVVNTQTLAGFVAADLTGDGNTDVVQVFQTSFIDPLFNNSLNGPVFDASLLPQQAAAAPPTFVDVNGDGVADALTLAGNGNILLRFGLANGSFQAPLLVNAGLPARAFTVYHEGASVRLATIDRSGQHVYLFSLGADGRLAFLQELTNAQASFPAALAAADLNGDGLDDLVVAYGATGTSSLPNLLQGEVGVYLAKADGSFGGATDYAVGGGPTQVTVADVTGDGTPDLLVADRISGDVTVLQNDSDGKPDQLGQFTLVGRPRAGFGVYQAGTAPLQPDAEVRSVQTQQETIAVLDGAFNEKDPAPDLVALNSRSNTFALLQAKGKGAFVDAPQSGLATGPSSSSAATVSQFFLAGADPVAVAAADLNGDGHLDLVILDRGSASLAIYLGDGKGGFTLSQQIAAGNLPSGVALRDVNGDGVLDAVVSNDFGDLLILAGKGDGTFAPYRRADDAAPLDVNPSGGQAPVVVVGNQAQDSVTVQQRVAGTNSFTPVFADGRDSNPDLLAPGAVVWENLDGHTDGLKDAVVASSGGNSVLIYHNTPQGLTAPVTVFVGTNPSALTFADLNGDGVPDLVVANTGSNDVSIFFGKMVNGRWTATPGPRLNAGTGPTAVAVLPSGDLAVTDGQTGQVQILHALGNGFFNDAVPQTLTVSNGPISNVIVLDQSLGNLPAGRSALALTAGGQIIGFDLGTGAAQTVFTPPNGLVIDAFQVVQPSGGGAPFLVTADAGGGVSVLTETTGANFADTKDVLATSGTPSALEVLETGPGTYDVYLTDTGTSVPVVIGLDLRVELQNAEATSGVSLVAVLVTEVSATPTTVQQGPATEAFNPFAQALSESVGVEALSAGEEASAEGEQLATLGQALLTAIIAPVGLGGDDEPPPDQPPPPDGVPFGLEQYLSGLAEALERLRQDEGAGGGAAAEAVDAVYRWLDGWFEGLLAPMPPQAPDDGDAPVRPEAAGPVGPVSRAEQADPPAPEAPPERGAAEAERAPATTPERGQDRHALLAAAVLAVGAQAVAGAAVALEAPRPAARRGRLCLDRPEGE